MYIESDPYTKLSLYEDKVLLTSTGLRFDFLFITILYKYINIILIIFLIRGNISTPLF